ncbi:MAG: hypothetical protein IJP68_04675 [Selenomonadaceae bacterium]|nr:hypothetical protein [Selenomonadaceae bacterium]
MANQFINVYKNNPTEGAKDGTLVSSGGTFTSPISIILSKSTHALASSTTIKLAIRTEAGYKTTGETIIKVADQKNKSLISWDTTFSETEISTTASITDTNKIFYLYSHSRDLEEGRDTDISVQVLYKIAAAD